MDKVILITGGSRGIGAATAILAAQQGYRICINYLTDAAAAHEVLAQVHALGAQAIAVRADVSNEEEIIGLFTRVDEELGPITALVNNADEAMFAADIAAGIVGEENVDRNGPLVMGSEDFSFMLNACPGAFILIGKHWQNLQRLMAGTEPKIGGKKKDA